LVHHDRFVFIVGADKHGLTPGRASPPVVSESA
jgi:hypothetical protein